MPAPPTQSHVNDLSIALARVLRSNRHMADGLYVGMSGAVARAQELESIADNLANAGTPGFKAARPAFESFLAQGANATDRASVAAVATGTDLRAGPRQLTGAPLDATPEDGNFFAVRTPQGKLAFTRDGRLSVHEDGTLRAAGGVLVSTRGEPIHVPPDAKIELDPSGGVHADGVEVDRIAVFQMKGNIERLNSSLLTTGQGGSAQMTDTRIRVGELELGNAPALESAVSMITAQRHYETSMQAIETYKKLGDKANEIGRIR